MEPDIGDLPFAVEFQLQLSQLSFGQHDGTGIISPPSDFSELDTLGAPVFFGRCFFGHNNLGEYSDENIGINCRCHGCADARISDGILGRIFGNDRADFSFAQVYAESERRAQVEIFLNPDVFEKIYLAKRAANFQLVTSLNEHAKIGEAQLKGRKELSKIIVEGDPGTISTTDRFTLDIGKEEFGRWWFRVRLVSLDFPSAESPPA